MNFSKKLIFIFCLFCGSFNVDAFAAPPDTLHYEILLNRRMLAELKTNPDFVPSVELTSNRLILLSTTDQLYLAGWGGMVPFGKKHQGMISSFAFTPDSALLIVRNNELCSFDSLNNLTALYKLPDEGMGISAGAFVMYVYGRNAYKEKNSLFVITRGALYTKLFDVPAPINSVTEMRDLVLFASGDAVYSYDINTKTLKSLVTVPDKKMVRSVVADTLTNRIFFSTDSAVYTMKDSKVSRITSDLGGALKFHLNGLIVFDPLRKMVVRITGIETAVAEKVPVVQEPARSEVLTNATISDLVKARLADEVIINLIKNSRVNFDLSETAIQTLTGQGVSPAVIDAMKNAMKK